MQLESCSFSTRCLGKDVIVSLKLVHLFQDRVVHWLIMMNHCTLAEELFCSLLATGQGWEYQNELGSTLQPE